MRLSGYSTAAFFVIAAFSVALVNCSGSGGNASSIIPHHHPSPAASPNNLYVADFDDDSILQYTPTISASSAPALELPNGDALGVTASGSFVVGTAEDTTSVLVWDQPVTNGANPAVTMDVAGGPELPAFDPSGNLWIALSNSSVAEFAPPFTDSSAPSQTVTTDVVDPIGLAFDSSANLYVVNSEASPQPQLLTFGPPYSGTPTILNLPLSSSAEAVDVATFGSIAAVTVFFNAGEASVIHRPLAYKHAFSNAWRASLGSKAHPLGEAIGGEILIYNLPISASSVPAATIPLVEAGAVAFDAAGNMYVSDEALPTTSGSIEVFVPPFTASSTPAFAITNTIEDPLGVATGP